YPGTNKPITTDQRGRPRGTPPDIGAYEVQVGGLATGRAALVTTLFTRLLGRAPEPFALAFWTGRLAAGASPAAVAAAIHASPEGRALQRQHRAPRIGLSRTLCDALLAYRRPAPPAPASAPRGPGVGAWGGPP